jgi:nucleoside triphosphatase
MRTIDRKIVGAFIFSSDDKILLCKMAAGGAYEGQWVVPGGGVDPGETPETAVIREVQEEVGIPLDVAGVRPLKGHGADTREKTLRGSGERVLVHMTFHDFEVRLPNTAHSIAIDFCDEFTDATFFDREEIAKTDVAPLTLTRLKNLWQMK